MVNLHGLWHNGVMSFSRQWRAKLCVLVGATAGGACGTAPAPATPDSPPAEPFPGDQSTVHVATPPDPTATDDPPPPTSNETGLCAREQLREVQCGQPTKETGFEATRVCPATSAGLSSPRLLNGFSMSQDLPHDPKQTDIQREKAKSPNWCCYSTCVPITTTAGQELKPLRPMAYRDQHCMDALESPSDHPSETRPECPAGIMIDDGRGEPIDATFNSSKASAAWGRCCYWGRERERRPYRGRALRVDAAPRLANPIPSDGWIGQQLSLRRALRPTDASQAARLCNAWLDAAAEEHASVAAFAKLTLELLALGAPPALVADTQRAGLDEIEHAKLSYTLASFYGEQQYGPGRLDLDRALATPVSAADVLEGTFYDGCVSETIATLAARRAAELAQCPVAGAVQHRIARDEQRHAELAWRIVAWLVTRFADAKLRFDALVAHGPESTRALPRRTTDRVHDADYGVLDGNAQRAVTNEAWRELIVPCAQRIRFSDSSRRRPGTRRAAFATS